MAGTPLAYSVGTAVAALCFLFAVWYVVTVRKRQKEFRRKNITLKTPGWLKALHIGGALAVAAAAGYAVSFYSFMVFLDDNLVYAALYHDGLAADLYRLGASDDAVLVASGTAWRFCELYKIEKRNLQFDRYYPVCDAIQKRNDLLAACYGDPEGPYCTEQLNDELDTLIQKADPLAKELTEETRPYFSYVFSEDYEPVACYIGDQRVPCPV